jgi:cyclomaltodextrinase
MYDPAPWLQGDVFDAVMHYRWYAPSRSFFAGAEPGLTATAYAAVLDSLAIGISLPHQRAMMNLTASHDTPRFSTSIYNPGRYKHRNTPREDSLYRIDRPDARTRRTQELILVQQFTGVGAPHIWNQDETTHPYGRSRPRNQVAPDTALLRVYRDLVALRKRHLRLFVDGSMKWLVADDARGVLAYERALGGRRAVVAFNVSDAVQAVDRAAVGAHRVAYTVGDAIGGTGSSGTIRLAPRSAQVWVR